MMAAQERAHLRAPSANTCLMVAGRALYATRPAPPVRMRRHAHRVMRPRASPSCIMVRAHVHAQTACTLIAGCDAVSATILAPPAPPAQPTIASLAPARRRSSSTARASRAARLDPTRMLTTSARCATARALSATAAWRAIARLARQCLPSCLMALALAHARPRTTPCHHRRRPRAVRAMLAASRALALDRTHVRAAHPRCLISWEARARAWLVMRRRRRRAHRSTSAWGAPTTALAALHTAPTSLARLVASVHRGIRAMASPAMTSTSVQMVRICVLRKEQRASTSWGL